MAEAREELPKYRILNYPGFFAEDSTLYPADTEIFYSGVPNEQMLPLNDAAKKKMDAYLDGLEQHHRRNMVERGLNPEIRRPRDMAETLDVENQVTKKIRVYNAAEGPVPQMGNLGKNKPSDVVIEAAPVAPKGKTKPVPILSAMNQSDAS